MMIKNRSRQLFFCLAVTVAASLSCSPPENPPDANDSHQAVTDKQSAANAVAQADKLFAQREDLAHVRQAIVLLRNARNVDPNNYDSAWRLAKFNYYLGANTKDEKERDKAFNDGIEAGKAAVKLQGNKPDGHFWLGANYGGRAEASALGGLASIDDIRQEMETVLKLDERYEGSSAYMVLGQVDLEAPKALGGDPQRAVTELEKGLRLAPNNSLMRLNLAKAYIANKRVDDARKQLNTLIAMQPDPDHVPEHKDAVAEARQIIDRGMKTE